MAQKIKLTAKRRPVLEELTVAQVTDKYSEYPSNGLTPVRLAQIFREADGGDVLRQMELFEEMEEKDPHLFSQIQTRKNAVTGLDYEVIPFSDDQRDKEIADFVAAQLASLENFEDIAIDLLDAIGKGFALSEIIWEVDAQNRVVIKDIRSRQQKRCFWEGVDDTFKIRTLEAPQGMPLVENKFILHRYKARSGHPSRAGILRVVAWMYLFKNYDVKDWISFAEIYGLPLRLGKYQPGASEADKAALMQALIQIGADAAGMVPDGTSIDFITTEKSSSTDLYERLARYCDEQISKAVLGQTLTSDSGGGSFAQSKTHNDVRHDLTVADAKSLAATLRRDLIRPLCILNYNEDTRIPSIKFDVEQSDDLAQLATILVHLVQRLGLKVPASYVYKKFSIPTPEPDEELVVPPKGDMLQLKESLALKDTESALGSQAHIDELTDTAIGASAPMWEEILDPILKIIENAGSLEELRAALESDAGAAALLEQMDGGALETLLQNTLLLADMEGRVIDDG